MIIGQQSDPVVLVGHSYGGTVITEAGNHPNVAALVYIAGWVPDAGESRRRSSPRPVRRAERGSLILPPQDGFLLLEREKMLHRSRATWVP